MTFPETFSNPFGEYPNSGAKLIEAKANGPALCQTLAQQIPGIIPIEPSGSKEARAMPFPG
jgi:phage terminase large subunit-like protein